MTKLIKYRLRKIIDTLFLLLAKITKTNLTYVGYTQKGILVWGNDEVTGEKFVREKILKKYIGENPVFFDVGSNIGEYSFALKNEFPDSKIYSFEPNPSSYKKIVLKAKEKDILFFRTGLSSTCGTGLIYDYEKDTWNQHASIYKEVITQIHKSENYVSAEFPMDTLDNFCTKNKIDKIDFLKIDTEGSELEVLKGGKEMLNGNKIKIIQFEFNEMNVISRTFLKDYYTLLKNYDIYRINPKKLVHLPTYKTENEIFKYQNFLAISKFI